MPINPVEWFPASLNEWYSGSWEGKAACPVVEGSFLIGNHADEMTVSVPMNQLL